MGSIYKEPQNRKQALLFPPSLDEYVDEDNPVRVIDAYVDMLDMVALGFTKANLHVEDGQPAYHPGLLLKIYIYGYLNKIRSSRRLEAEIRRNVEMMWLCAGLHPGYKTIANFRKENSAPLKKVFREFALLIKNLNLITGEVVAVDGAYFRANASKNQLLKKKTIEKDLKALDAKIDAYLAQMQFADANEKQEKSLKPPVTDLATMQTIKKRLDDDLAFLEANHLTQYNRTDPDARLMVKPAHNLMAFNVQITVDSTWKFVVATEVSSQGNDRNKLHTMALQTREIVANDAMVFVGDTGYYNAQEIARCVQDKVNVVVSVPKAKKSQKEKGFYLQSDFTYEEQEDCYWCPHQQKLTRSPSAVTRGKGTRHFVYRASSAVCKACPIRDNCIPKKTARKSIMRSEYADTVAQHKEKMQTPEAKRLIRQRGAIAEHPFGTIKQHLGWSHFLVRGLEKVGGENALIMFAYNFRRLLNLIGTGLFHKLIQAIPTGDIEVIRQEIAEYLADLADITLYYAIIWLFGGERAILRRKNIV